MKKLVLLLLSVSLAGMVWSEEMKFVTTLSQPVGSFARVESVNAERPAQALQVNFCNNKVSSGNINVDGAVRAAYLKLDNTGSLGGNVPVYQLKTLKLGSTKSFEGGNVWANEANPAKIKAEGTLYGKDMSYLVAELPALQIKSGSTVQDNIRSGGPAGEDMEWSAQYTCDYASVAGEGTGEVSYSSVTQGAAYETELRDTCDGNPFVEFSGVPEDGSCLDVYITWCGGTGSFKSPSTSNCQKESDGVMTRPPSVVCGYEMNSVADACNIHNNSMSGCSRGSDGSYGGSYFREGSFTGLLKSSGSASYFGVGHVAGKYVLACSTKVDPANAFCFQEAYLYCKTAHRTVTEKKSDGLIDCTGEKNKYNSYVLKSR